MKKRLKNLCINITALGFVSSVGAYIVKQGDSLSSIAKKEISKYVYGKNGSLGQLISLNPQIKNPNFIRTGQVINLPKVEQTSIAEIQISNPREMAAEPTNQKIVESEVVSQKAPPFKRGATLTLNPEYSLLILSAKDRITQSSSMVASKSYLRLKTSYEQKWSDSLQSAIYLRLAQVQFEKPTSSKNTLSDSGKFLSSIGLETTHKFTENLNILAQAEFGKELFLRANTTTSVAVDAVNIGTLGMKTNYNLAHLEPFIIGISGSYELKLPASPDGYDVKLGHQFRGSIYLNQFVDQRSKFLTELGVRYRTQDTNVTTQSETNIFLGLTFSFGSEK